MNDTQRQVREFMEKFHQHMPLFPELVIDEKVRKLRIKLIEEEWIEFREASDAGDLVGIADAIADLLYVVYGAANAYGLDAEGLVDEVHRSNMTKLWPDGSIRQREDGKVIKPPTYSEANIAEELRLQGPAR